MKYALSLLCLLFMGCEPMPQNQVSAPPQSKYRIVQMYGANDIGANFSVYHADDIKFDGVWLKFYDKDRRQLTRMSGNIFIEGGEN